VELRGYFPSTQVLQAPEESQSTQLASVHLVHFPPLAEYPAAQVVQDPLIHSLQLASIPVQASQVKSDDFNPKPEVHEVQTPLTQEAQLGVVQATQVVASALGPYPEAQPRQRLPEQSVHFSWMAEQSLHFPSKVP